MGKIVMEITLLNKTTDDGSRWFASMPENRSWEGLRDHLAGLNGVKITKFLNDQITVVWIDFVYRGNKFSINNQGGEYWFFVREPNCQDDILIEVVKRCQAFLY